VEGAIVGLGLKLAVRLGEHPWTASARRGRVDTTLTHLWKPLFLPIRRRCDFLACCYLAAPLRIQKWRMPIGVIIAWAWISSAAARG